MDIYSFGILSVPIRPLYWESLQRCFSNCQETCNEKSTSFKLWSFKNNLKSYIMPNWQYRHNSVGPLTVIFLNLIWVIFYICRRHCIAKAIYNTGLLVTGGMKAEVGQFLSPHKINIKLDKTVTNSSLRTLEADWQRN